MIKQLTLNILSAIKQHGAISVFWAGIIEQIISPIPSVLIPMSAGFLIIPRHLNTFLALWQILQKISLPYAFGATLGSSVLFLGAFFGGQILIKKFGRFFGLSLQNIKIFKSRFTKGFKDEIIIFFLVTLPVTPISLVAASCGVIGISPWEFYPLLLAGTFVRSLFLGWLGWQAGETYKLIGTGLNKIETLFSVAGLAVIASILAFLYYRRKKVLGD